MKKRICVIFFIVVILAITTCVLTACIYNNQRKTKSYTVTTNSNLSGAGTYTQMNHKKIGVGEEVTLTARTNDGYTWLGWYDGETKVSNGDSLTYTFTMESKNKEYTAKWTYYTVTSIGNSFEAGSCSTLNAAKVSVGKTVTLTARTNEGYTFLGWYDGNNKVSDGNSTSYTFTMTNENKVFIAKWDCFTVTTTGLSYMGSFTQMDNVKIRAGETVILKATINDGYTFLGWYDGNNKVSEDGNLSYIFTMPAESKVFTARLCKCPVELEKNINEAGSVSGLEKTIIGKETTITAKTNNGYTFIGWYNGDEKVSSCPSYTFTMVGYSITFTAKWVQENTITTYSNLSKGGTYTEMYMSNVAVGEEVKLEAKPNEGYTWLGWYDGEEKVTDSLVYTFIMPNYPKVFTAKFACFTIRTVCPLPEAGEDTQLSDVKVRAGDNVTLTAKPVKGYTFIGWYCGAEKLTDDFVCTFTMPYENVLYRALYEGFTVTTYNNFSDAGSCTNMYGFSITAGEEVTLEAIPNEGYIFLGWFDGDEKVSKDDNTSYTFTMPYESKTFTAKFDVKVDLDLFSYEYIDENDSCRITGIKNKEIRELTIPDGVTSIGYKAFEGCTSLSKVIIPEGVTIINSYAFNNCTSLSEIVIPDSLANVGSYAFNNTKWYNEQSDGVVYVGKVVYRFKGEMPENTVIILKDNTKAISDNAFSSCKNLQLINIPNCVTYIGNNAFYDCSSLINIEIPDSVVSLGNSAFRQCFSLENVTIGASVSSIGDDTFLNCRSLTTVIIPDSVTRIGLRAFASCKALTSVVIGKGVESIGTTAFLGCNSLSEVILEEGLISIENNAFMGCQELTEIIIPSTVESIGFKAFYGCNLTKITIPDSVTSIGQACFSRCFELESITFEDPTNWYTTPNITDWQNKTNGIEYDLSDPTDNVTFFNEHSSWYLYKLED